MPKFRQYLWNLLTKGWTRWRASYSTSSAVSFTQLKTNIYSPKWKLKMYRLSQINHSFQKYILLWVSDQPPQRNYVTKSADVSDLDNFWRKVLLKNCTFPTTYPKNIYKKLLRRLQLGRLHLKFLIHCLFFPAFPSSISDLPLLLFLFSLSVSILFSILRIYILSSSSSAFMLYSPTEQPIPSSCTPCMALAHAIIELQCNKAAGMHCISSTQAFSRAVTPNETIEGLGILCDTTQTSLKEIFAGQVHVDRL